MSQAEDLESVENLHALCSLIQTICASRYLPVLSKSSPTRPPVTLNDHTMYEHILDDDIFLGVVGMLECMPS